MKLSKEFIRLYHDAPFNGTYNCIAINGILNHKNVYKYAWDCNNYLGNKMNLVTEDTLIDGVRLEDFFNRDPIYQDLKLKVASNICCDYIRYKLICEYNYNNFIDLDLVINPTRPLVRFYSESIQNSSMVLFNDLITRYQWNVWLDSYKQGKIMVDNTYYLPEKYYTVPYNPMALPLSGQDANLCDTVIVMSDLLTIEELTSLGEIY